jgi:ribosomal protein L37AE/L43A
MLKLLRALWSYCINCQERQDFILKDGKWLCGKCGKSLTYGTKQGTIVTGG